MLVNVAIELAVFRRGEATVGGELLSLSLDTEFRESHEKGLVSFRLGGGGATGGGATDVTEGWGLFAGDSAGGDHGIAGSAFVMLLKDRVLLAWSSPAAAGVTEITSMVSRLISWQQV